MAESWLICENGYQTKCVDCPIRDENAEPCEHAIKVAPVRHGRWALNKKYGDYECSECGQGDVKAMDFTNLKMRYCPNCGAKMYGAE